MACSSVPGAGMNMYWPPASASVGSLVIEPMTLIPGVKPCQEKNASGAIVGMPAPIQPVFNSQRVVLRYSASLGWVPSRRMYTLPCAAYTDPSGAPSP